MHPLLADRLLLRYFETPLLYDIISEDTWELDEEAFTLFQYFTGHHSIEQIAKKLGVQEEKIKEIVKEFGPELILNKHAITSPVQFQVPHTLVPSLRAVLIHITSACNLTCRHCYLQKGELLHLEPALFHSAVQQLDDLQGLKVLISGGEPLLHPKVFEMLHSIQPNKLRKILLTNGLLIDASKATRLKGLIHEVQISLDGIKSHNNFRNHPLAFDKSVQSIKHLTHAGLEVSVATMIHSQNLEELEELESILKDLEVKSWALDVPSKTGAFLDNPDLNPPLEEAGAALRRYGWGAPLEDTHSTYACGAHLCAVMPNGDVAKCGFFADKPVGNLNQTSLSDCWRLVQKNYIWEQKELECAKLKCPHLGDCRGGCRFRASVETNSRYGIDPVKCAAFNFKNSRRSDA
ncbi:MAG: radical SAM protein [Candidatus Helarchaeota archaeon]|nr:radical SAM protein [Candidatus Helarchaeota archaeon]